MPFGLALLVEIGHRLQDQQGFRSSSYFFACPGFDTPRCSGKDVPATWRLLWGKFIFSTSLAYMSWSASACCRSAATARYLSASVVIAVQLLARQTTQTPASSNAQPANITRSLSSGSLLSYGMMLSTPNTTPCMQTASGAWMVLYYLEALPTTQCRKWTRGCVCSCEGCAVSSCRPRHPYTYTRMVIQAVSGQMTAQQRSEAFMNGTMDHAISQQ